MSFFVSGGLELILEVLQTTFRISEILNVFCVLFFYIRNPPNYQSSENSQFLCTVKMQNMLSIFQLIFFSLSALMALIQFFH